MTDTIVKQNIDEQLINVDMLTRDNESIQTMSHRTSTPIHKTLQRFVQPTRTILNKSSSLTSILTNTSSAPTSPENIYWIELSVERGKDLSVKDLNGTSDPYVKVYYGPDEKYISSTVHKNLNPIWNEKVSFIIYDLTIPVSFQLFDYDRIGRDESMGTAKLDLTRIPLEKSYPATLELENEKRTDGKTGMLDISITITLKTSEFRDEVKLTNNGFCFFYSF